MNLMDLFIKISVDDQASKKVSSISTKLGKGLKTAAKIGAAAVGTASAAIVKLAKDSISAFAEYEQLEGGVKKLFGNDMTTVLANADKAYKTAGMSANQYLETTTSFAASLISGLNGDTAKAAEIADKAIRDMSDNANTFGTDISLIQNAYQGFAKQNYTMLDNLRLGYGGTASEMARLINDSGVLGDTVTVTASNINRVSFDKIIEAINVTQDRMGIMETTVNEAGTTIQGSITAMKASWENLITALSSGTGDVDQKIAEFVESVVTVGEKLKPVAKTAISGIVTLVKTLGPQIIKELPGLVQELLPEALNAAMGLVGSLSDMLLNGGAETLLDTAFDMLFMLLDGLLVALTDGDVIGKITQLIIDLALKLTDPETLKELLGASLEIIKALANGLSKNIPELVKAVPDMILGIVQAISSPETMYSLWETGRAIIVGLWNGVSSAKEWFKEQIAALIVDAFALFGNKGAQEAQSQSGGGWLYKLFNGSHKNGLSYVPFDGYVAELHKGERVLTEKEAKAYNSGIGGNGSVINITINGASYSDEQSLANAVSIALQNTLDRRNAAYA